MALTGVSNSSGIVTFAVPLGASPVYTISVPTQSPYASASTTKAGPTNATTVSVEPHGAEAMTGEERRDGGFTLVEVMVATSILGVVLALVFSSLNGGVRQAADAQSRAFVEADVRVVADAFVRDLRQAYTGDSSLNRIDSMSATQITFYSPDRQTPFHLRKISYKLNGTDLQRSTTVSTDTDGFPWVFGTTAGYVTALQYVRNATVFVYRDEDGNVTTDPTAVSVVDLNLTVDQDTTKGPAAYVYSTTVEIRGT